MGEWQPIETAPKDGSWIIIYGGVTDDYWDGLTEPMMVCAQWTHELNGQTYDEGRWHFAWYDGGYYGEYEQPTHWMPLPTPPDA